MSRNVRDLRNAGFYLVVLVALAGGIVLGSGLIAARVGASSAIQSLASVFDSESSNTPTRLSLAVGNAREIRAALEKPIPGPAPLQPITEKLAYGHLKPGKSALAARLPKLPKTALDAMASADTGAQQAQAPLPRVELHRVY